MMNAEETRKYEMLARVREFGISHAAVFPPGTMASDLLAQVTTAVEQLSAHSVAQATSAGVARQGAASRKQARDTLRADLEMLSRTAADISDRIPNVNEMFRLPRSGRDRALLDAARSFAANAVPIRAEFAQHELTAEFFARLEVHIAIFEEAFTVQMRGREARIAAGAAIDDALTAGVRAARKLGTIVKNKMAGDPVLLQAWATAIRIRRRATHSAQPEPVAETV